MGTILTEAVSGPDAWKGSELARKDSWLYRLSPHVVAELDAALHEIERRALSLFEITREDFPLPGFGTELKKISKELESGRGFVQSRSVMLAAGKIGGASLIVSAMALYNELLQRYPWYVGVLYNRFNYDWRGEQAKDRPPIYRWPVFEYYDGQLSCRYSRRMIEFAQQTTGAMLSEIEKEAFDIMDGLIDELQLNINFEPGDMQFLNNYVILHSRTAFEDYPEPDRKRHLLRLWLAVPHGRRLSPETLRERDVRLGVPVAEPAPA